MYSFEDLFDRRSTVGANIERILDDRKITKVELCKNTGVSRPTIDKLLAGTLTSKTNYEKHISKVLTYLKISPDGILGTTTNNIARRIRNMCRISTETISQMTSIPEERIRTIETGSDATLAELRDIAVCLSVGVGDLLGQKYFETQVGEMDDFIHLSKEDDIEEISGFWGHIGILLEGDDMYHWYPITRNTRSMVYQMMDDRRMVVPCMNNRALLLNMENVRKVMLLDEACDAPGDADWDPKVSCGEIPNVIYEALEEYGTDDYQETSQRMSDRLKRTLDNLIRKNEWTEDEIYQMLNDSLIYYTNGKAESHWIEFGERETLSEEVMCICDYQDEDLYSDILRFEEMDGPEIILNMKYVAMLEMPLLKLENAILSILKDMN